MELLAQRGFATPAAPQAHHPPADRSFYDRTLYQPTYQAPAQVPLKLRAGGMLQCT